MEQMSPDQISERIRLEGWSWRMGRHTRCEYIANPYTDLLTSFEAYKPGVLRVRRNSKVESIQLPPHIAWVLENACVSGGVIFDKQISNAILPAIDPDSQFSHTYLNRQITAVNQELKDITHVEEPLLRRIDNRIRGIGLGGYMMYDYDQDPEYQLTQVIIRSFPIEHIWSSIQSGNTMYVHYTSTIVENVTGSKRSLLLVISNLDKLRGGSISTPYEYYKLLSLAETEEIAISQLMAGEILDSSILPNTESVTKTQAAQRVQNRIDNKFGQPIDPLVALQKAANRSGFFALRPDLSVDEYIHNELTHNPGLMRIRPFPFKDISIAFSDDFVSSIGESVIVILDNQQQILQYLRVQPFQKNVIELLLQNPSGLSPEEMAARMNIKISTLISFIGHARKPLFDVHDIHLRIISANGRYILIKESEHKEPNL